MRNARIACGLLDAIIEKKGVLDLANGARSFARQQARVKGPQVRDLFVYTAFARRGWMVPNQYWTPGVLAPMPIMGKYYMVYGDDFLPPRELGRRAAGRMVQELIMDNMGICRFHRAWAEEMLPEIVQSLWGMKDRFLEAMARTATRINNRNSSIFWESQRTHDLVHTFLKRKQEQGSSEAELLHWKGCFERDSRQAALDFWYDMHKGVHESLSEVTCML
jgi:glyceraldehyde-3-phosphate dehydrogenase (ferredoxin)